MKNLIFVRLNIDHLAIKLLQYTLSDLLDNLNMAPPQLDDM